MALDAHMFRLVMLVEVYVQYLVALPGFHDLAERAVFVVHEAGSVKVVGYHVALATDNLFGGGVVGGAVGRVGRHDSVVLVHQYKRVGVRINHGLQI